MLGGYYSRKTDWSSISKHIAVFAVMVSAVIENDNH